MSDATIADVYGAVFDAVETLGPSPGTGSFKTVLEFAGEVTQEQVEQVTHRKYPAALIAYAAEDSTNASLDTLTGEMETVVRAQLVVYVASLALRGTKRAQNNEPTGVKGLFTLTSEVVGAVNGLRVEGLYGTKRVHYSGMRPALLRTGALYVYALRFEANRCAEQATIPDDSVPLTDVQGSENIVGSGTLTNVNPVSRTRNQFP